MSKKRSLSDLRADIERTRDRLEELTEQPLHVSELRERIVTELTRQADDAAGQYVFNVGREYTGTLRYHREGFGIGDLAMALGPAVLADRIIEHVAPHCGELKDDERTAQIAKVKAELQRLERAELEQLVELARDGRLVDWRADTDIELFLEVIDR